MIPSVGKIISKTVTIKTVLKCKKNSQSRLNEKKSKLDICMIHYIKCEVPGRLGGSMG